MFHRILLIGRIGIARDSCGDRMGKGKVRRDIDRLRLFVPIEVFFSWIN